MKFIVTLNQELRYYVEAEDDEEAVRIVTQEMDPADAFASAVTSNMAVVEEVDDARVN